MFYTCRSDVCCGRILDDVPLPSTTGDDEERGRESAENQTVHCTGTTRHQVQREKRNSFFGWPDITLM